MLFLLPFSAFRCYLDWGGGGSKIAANLQYAFDKRVEPGRQEKSKNSHSQIFPLKIKFILSINNSEDNLTVRMFRSSPSNHRKEVPPTINF